MDTGNAGKRINLFSEEGGPTLSELERMEAVHKERGISIAAEVSKRVCDFLQPLKMRDISRQKS